MEKLLNRVWFRFDFFFFVYDFGRVSIYLSFVIEGRFFVLIIIFGLFNFFSFFHSFVGEKSCFIMFECEDDRDCQPGTASVAESNEGRW